MHDAQKEGAPGKAAPDATNTFAGAYASAPPAQAGSALDLGPGYVPAFIVGEVLPKLPRRPAAGVHDALFTLARVLSPWRSEARIEAVLRDYTGVLQLDGGKKAFVLLGFIRTRPSERGFR